MDKWTSTRVSRKGATYARVVGQTMTCPCGFDYIVGSADMWDHFVFAANRTGRLKMGECPILYGLELACHYAAMRGHVHIWLPGEDEPRPAAEFLQRPEGVAVAE